MSSHNSTKAVIYAFSANAAIAVAKTGAALWTGSGSMMAEAIHSFADCGNQLLLFVGMRRSSLSPSEKHPMGYERESYIWSMMVAVLLFTMGGLFSVYEGWHRLANPEPVTNAEVSIIILAIGFVLEGASMRGALNALKEERGDLSLWDWFKDTSSSELLVVVGEDLAAIVGLGIALSATVALVITGNVIYDSIGSILVGVLLVVTAALVSKEVHSLIVGESAVAVKGCVETILSQRKEVVRVFNIFAIHHGASVMVAIKAELPALMLVGNASQLINEIEREIKLKNPSVKWVFFEIDNID